MKKEWKWKVKKDGKDFGTLVLCNPQIAYFDVIDGKGKDFLLAMDIIGISEEIQKEIEKAIEIGKEKVSAKNAIIGKELNQERRTVWSDAPLNVEYLGLSIDLKENEEDEILFCAYDGIYRDELGVEGRISVDLSEHIQELRDVITEQLMEIFNQFF